MSLHDPLEHEATGDQRAQDQRRRILESARSVFLDKGYAGGSMEMIASLAGVSPTTIYRSIGNKEALFERLALSEARQIARALPALNLRGDDPAASLQELARAIGQAFEQPAVQMLLRLIIGTLDRFPTLGDQFFQKSIGEARFQIAGYFDLEPEEGSGSFERAEGFITHCLARPLMQLFAVRPAWRPERAPADAPPETIDA
jgi:AcrR family transcriptional regulator